MTTGDAADARRIGVLVEPVHDGAPFAAHRAGHRRDSRQAEHHPREENQR
jgi:hypothetical protein